MRTIKKKRKKDTAHRAPPLSGLDQAIYITGILLSVALLFGFILGWLELQKRIAFSDPAVIAYKAGIAGAMPFFLLIVLGGVSALAVCYNSKRPIFGNKAVRYGEHPWKTDLFPLFGPQHSTIQRRPSKQRFRRIAIRVVAGMLALTLLPLSLSIFKRICLRDDRTIVPYNSLNKPGTPISIPRDCDQITIRASKETISRGGSPSWRYGIILSCENGKKYEFNNVDFDTPHRGHTDCLRQLLSIKALFSPDQLTIERSDLLPDVIEYNRLDEAQTALLRELFDPPR